MSDEEQDSLELIGNGGDASRSGGNAIKEPKPALPAKVETPPLPSMEADPCSDEIVSTVQSALSHKGNRILIIRDSTDYSSAKRYIESLKNSTGEFVIRVNPKIGIPALWRRA